MKLHQVKTSTTLAKGVSIQWAGSKTEAAKIRGLLTASGVKKADITTSEVDVPTSKGPLIEFLNKMYAG